LKAFNLPGLPPALAQRLWVVGPLALAVAPHLLRMPAWLSLVWLLCAALSLSLAGKQPPAVLRWLKAVLALAGIGAVLASYGSLIGPGGGIALLVLLSGAKLLEVETPRDRIGVLFIGIFLLVAHFLARQGLPDAAWMTLAVLALTAGLVGMHGGEQATARQLRQSLVLLLQALPLALLLFVLFPRLQGPLWGLPHESQAATGLSDRMRPGDISQLILSNELALRAEFAGSQPRPEQLYWRGPVFWDFDGRGWGNDAPGPNRPPMALARGEVAQVSITLEAQHQPWLLLLGFPRGLPDIDEEHRTYLSADLQWRSDKPINQRLRYSLDTYLDYRLDPQLDPRDRQRALALPEGNPQTRVLAATLGQDQAAVQAALTLFREQPFHYTLRPPLLGDEPIDDFLFRTRSGFCEHYASSFVWLMRAAGVPARVVTGYQGGEFNQLGRYWTVHGRDAHAWAEVWLPEQGWLRVDPTAAVSPSRVSLGLDAAIPAAERPLRQVMFNSPWLMPLRLGWDLVNQRWNQWVLGYDDQRQRQFLQRISPALASLAGMVTGLTLSAALLVGGLALWLWLRPLRGGDPLQRLWRQYAQRLARIGLQPLPAEAPEQHARRVAAARPDLAAECAHITRLYLDLRYGHGRDHGLAALRRALHAFRPKPPA
jgi:transglutaminase-like putative cysteine protease